MNEQDGKVWLGQQVRRARKRLGLSQRELADRVGVSQIVVSNVENGISAISVPDLNKWSEALKQPVLYFVDGSQSSLESQMRTLIARVHEDDQDLFLRLAASMVRTLEQRRDEGV